MMLQKKLSYTSSLFGQLVVGPPGSGKSTYCYHMSKFLQNIDRNIGVVNMDPANENVLYKPEIDIMELICLNDVMDYFNLGPNGALIYCIEYIEKNIEWLLNKLKLSRNTYFIFDCPGQVELYTHCKSMSNIFQKLESNGYYLCTVHLIDSHYCSEPTKFISTLLLSLNTMLQMALPHVSVLSKADLLSKYKSKLLFNLDFYLDVLDLKYLLNAIQNDMSKYVKLNNALISMIEDYSLVSFQPLDVKKINSLISLKNIIDKANGYVFNSNDEKGVNSLLTSGFDAKTSKEKMANDINSYL